ncbi:hypothetical protein [Myroides fluvii]|uniref:hypothetical protein n=1 Tax=Myroides fluvii TaxID=2572594 RepID=UPI00131B6FA7|nr:hypothetical protein [Myroides fluvii]
MIRKIVPLIVLVMSGSAMAQVGIGTPKANSSAQLDIVSTEKGVLLPRVKLVAIDDHSVIKGDIVESLLVYHIGNSNLKAGFYYWKSNVWTPLLSGEMIIDRKNNTFTIGVDPSNGKESLIITDTENHSVYLAVTELANNKTFVENIANNNDFITKLGDNLDFINHITNNEQFIEDIVNMLKGTYGNVSYDVANNSFYYFDENEQRQEIDWEALNTVNVSFTLNNDQLIVTDSAGNSVYLAVTELANNKTFVENIANNNDFITKLGDNIDFINHITNNEQFIEDIVNMLKGTYGNVSYDVANNSFYYFDENEQRQEIDWEALNTVNVSFTLNNDQLIVTDSAGNSVYLAVTELANNKTFVENIANNNDFITKLGDNIDFINHITNNEQFIEDIVNMLKGTYGNVSYDVANNSFYYFDENEQRQEIDWEALNTVNVSFTLNNDQLIVTDSAGNSVYLAVTELANNKTFVENIANNNDFITKLGDNIDFINHITNNEQFIEDIVNMLKGTYGNVSYDVANNSFYYFDENEQRQEIDWEALNTVNVSFTLKNDQLIVTDSAGNSVYLAVTELANNKTFVENIANNNDFITKLGDNIDFINHITNNEQFIEDIVNMLKGTYGNVSYDVANNSFYYFDENEQRQEIDWEALNTVNVSFTLNNDQLIVTDSDGNSVYLAVTELANNKTFVENIANNNDFITKLGDNIDFINHITNNEQFIEDIVNMLKGTYGNVSYDVANNSFYYFDENEQRQEIDWEALNTVNVSFTLNNDQLIVTDSDGNSVYLAVTELANNKTFVENIANNNDFITKLGDNIDFINHITNNEQFIEDIVNMLKGTYGNVSYDVANNSFYYFDENEQRQEIDWEALNTVNVSFTLNNDQLIVTDSAGNSVYLAVTELANNKTFVENIANNNDFITKLGDNLDFINHITNNEQFIEDIVNMLKGTYGNVSYDVANNSFYYFDENEQRQEIDWEALNTVNVSFTLNNDQLIVTDSDGNSVYLAVTELANNKTFVENIANNNDFITKLGDNLDFINHITNNEQFIEDIVNMLKGTYGNVSYDVANNSFYYFDENEQRQEIDWEALNTVNVSFTLNNDQLIVTDSDGNSVYLAVTELANNKTFVENIANNNDFITKLGDNLDFINHITNNEQFIEDIVNMLKGTYGNVSYDVANNSFYYFDENEQRQEIDWEALNTVNVSFTLNNDQLIVTDSDGNSVYLAVTELANNKTFVENIANNNDFITKLGDNLDFQTIIKNNSVESTLILTDTTTNADQVKSGFVFNNGKNTTNIAFAETLTALEKGVDANTMIEYYFVDETGNRDDVVITVTQDIINDFGTIINDNRVKDLLEQFITIATGDVSVIRDNGDIIIKTATNSFNITEEIKAKETNTVLIPSVRGVYVYKNEEAIKTGGAGVTINIVSDVQNNFEEIIKNEEVKNILNKYITEEVEGNVTYKDDKFYVTIKNGDVYETKEITLKELVQNNGETLETDGVIGVTVHGGTTSNSVEKAVLKSLKLSLNQDVITTEHIKDGTIQPIDLAEANANQVLVTGADKKPVWKDQGKMAPQFFYMPAVIFDTAATGTATRDLYEEYVNQFTGGSANSNSPVPYPISHGPAGTTPIQYGGGIVGSAGAPADIAVFENHELYYYVTYFDEDVFENLVISADGKLTYTVKAGATPSSYMNIVFVIK